MKVPTKASLILLLSCALITPSHAATFDVFRANATFTGFVPGVNTEGRAIITPYRLTTRNLINLARGRPRNSRVPRNEVLAGAGDAAAMESFDLDVVKTAAQQLIVFDTTTDTKLATILVLDTATVQVAENRILRAFRRIGFGKSNIPGAGNATNGITSGVLDGSATLTRRIVPPGAPPRPRQVNLSHGVIEVADGGEVKAFFVLRGVISIAGPRLGQFVE